MPQTPSAHDDSLPATATLRAVRKTFGDFVALDELSADIRPGETVALLGRNGAGKTTALKILLGLTRPDRGRVEIFGGSPTAPAARSRIGCQFQQTALYPLITVAEALDLFGGYYPSRRPTTELLEAFDLTARRTAIFQRLSGGERQRLALALAFVGNPSFLVLDEPTTALDIAARHAVWHMIRRFNARGGTVLLTTHLIEEAETLGHRVMILHHGRIADSGSCPDLVARHAGGDAVEFSLSMNGERAAAVRETLQRRFVVDGRPDLWTARGAARDVLVQAVVDAAMSHGAGLTGLRVRPGSLEQVFLGLTHEEAA